MHARRRWLGRVRRSSVVGVLVLGGVALSGPAAQAADACPGAAEVVFAPPTGQHAATGDQPLDLVAADLDGDSFLDVVVADYDSAAVSVLLGDGAGGFGTKNDFATGINPIDLALGDLNGDTIIDLVVADYGSGAVSVLRGNGAGGFGTKIDYPVGGNPYALALGDLDGDSFLDVVVAHPNAAAPASVLRGNGRGRLGTPTPIAIDRVAQGVLLADLDGDDVLDLVVTGERVSVLLGDGAGGFGPQTDLETGGVSYDAAAGDLDGDGDLDLAVPNYWPSLAVSVLLGDGAGGFAAATDVEAGEFLYGVVVTDLSGDLVPDLAVGGYRGLWALVGDGAGGFAPPVEVAGYSQAFAVGDVDGDGRSDLAATALQELPAGDFQGVVQVALNRTGDPAAPCAPAIGAAAAGNEAATVSWTAPASDGGSPIIGYIVTPYIGFAPQGPRYFQSTSTTQTVTGLMNGTTYRFRVRAWNAVGVSEFSTVSNAVTPSTTVGTPGAPTIGSATAGDRSATVSWTAPASDGGSPIIGYVVTPYIGFAPQGPRYFQSTSTTQTVTGLTNGTTYRFRVRAWSSAGVGSFSRVTNPVIPGP